MMTSLDIVVGNVMQSNYIRIPIHKFTTRV